MHLYELLDVSPNSTAREIENAYCEKIGAIEADYIPVILNYLDIGYPYRYAYSVLSNANTRLAYDNDVRAFDGLTLPEYLLM